MKILRNRETGEIIESKYSIANLAEKFDETDSADLCKNIATSGATIKVEMYSAEDAKALAEKLCSWQRLKECGFEFAGFDGPGKICASIPERYAYDPAQVFYVDSCTPGLVAFWTDMVNVFGSEKMYNDFLQKVAGLPDEFVPHDFRGAATEVRRRANIEAIDSLNAANKTDRRQG